MIKTIYGHKVRDSGKTYIPDSFFNFLKITSWFEKRSKKQRILE